MSVLQDFKCPCCDGAISFDSHAQQLKCPYCDTEFDVETLDAYTQSLLEKGQDSYRWEENQQKNWQEEELTNLCSYVCQSCGGELIADQNTAATTCPYCGNAVVMTEKVSGNLRPDFVIPFKLDKKAAKEALKKHYQGKLLLPKAFKTENHIEKIKGIYVPFWLFDAKVDAHIRYKATRTRIWSDSRYNYTETSHYAVIRAGSVEFEWVPVDGSSKIDDTLMESVEPYDFSQAEDFRTAYLAGYLADKYDVDAESSIPRANARMKESTEAAFASTVIGYNSVVPTNANIQLTGGKTRYALYPVWLLNTTWQGKKYTFAMNGQTGKMVGDLPMDTGLFVKWLLGLTAAITAVAYGISCLL